MTRELAGFLQMLLSELAFGLNANVVDQSPADSRQISEVRSKQVCVRSVAIMNEMVTDVDCHYTGSHFDGTDQSTSTHVLHGGSAASAQFTGVALNLVDAVGM